MRATFVFQEIGIGLRRNLTMTVAVIVTVMISLALLGVGLLIRMQVDTMKGYWYDKVEVAVFLCNDDRTRPSCSQGPVTDPQRTQIRDDLDGLPQVEKIYYESQDEAYQRWQEGAEDKEYAGSVPPDAFNEAFRVKLRDPEEFEIVADAFDGRPGVFEVQDQREVLEKFFKVLNVFQNGAWLFAGLALVAAVLLVANTMRLAAFSRRRETGIMRLVGASNFYIQLPFLLEGAIAGLIGASLASGLMIVVKRFIIENLIEPAFPFFAFIGWDAVWTTVFTLLVTGVLLSSLASFFTLRKYLRV